MNTQTAGIIEIAVVVALVGALHIPLGDYVARVYTTDRHWEVEQSLYRLSGTDPDADQRWPQYLRSMLAFSFVSVIVRYAMLRWQSHLPLSIDHPEVLYAFLSAGNSNGSAFTGLNANTTVLNNALDVVMLLGRYLPMIFVLVLVLALAGSFAKQRRGIVTPGTVASHRPMFVGLTVSAALLLSAVTYFPAVALGPLADGLH